MGVSPSALSHAIKGLEEQIGVRLLARTTRSVTPTDAGEQLIARLDPALTDIREALGRRGVAMVNTIHFVTRHQPCITARSM